MHTAGFMARFRISTRIAAGFIIVLTLVAVLGWLGIVGLRSADRAFSRYSTISENTLSMSILERNFMALRRNVVLFADSGDETILARARQMVAELKKDTSDLAGRLVFAERRSRLLEIGKLIDGYAANLDAAARARLARERAVTERMNVFGQKAEENFTQVVKTAMADGDSDAAARAGLVQDTLMQVRLNANRFLARPDASLLNVLKQHGETLRSDGAKLVGRLNNPERKRLAIEAAELGGRYLQAVDEVVRATEEVDKLVNKTMSEQAESIAKSVSEFIAGQRGDLARLITQTQNDAESAIWLMILIAVASVLFGSSAAFAISRGIVKPVSGLTAGMKELAAGNFDLVLPGLDRKDEVGVMAQAVETFKVKLAEESRREAEEKAAEEARLAAERKAEMHRLADRFQAAVGNIIETVSSASTELEAAAATLTKTAETTQHLSGQVAATSEQASANVQSVATATEEMSGSVNEISRQVVESSKIAANAVRQADATDARINELSQAAARIGDVVKLITAIAEQTNLLALNATIEAARAGEAGKGFAVVAQEVKALAAQTAKATDEIGTQISGMQTATQQSVAAIKEIGQTIGQIADISSTIAAAVEEQGAATQEISRNVQQAAAGTAQVASNITEVNRGAGETGSASAQVLASAQALSSESNHLKIEVEKFLATVRAA